MGFGRKAVLGLFAIAGLAGCGFLIAEVVIGGLAQASLWSAVVAAIATIAAAGLSGWPLTKRPSWRLPTPVPELPGWVVNRPKELGAVVSGLVNQRSRTVGVTTGLFGAGGFGKTTLALMTCANRRVRRRFGGRVYMVTIGRDVLSPAAIAAKVNDVIRWVSGEDSSFVDPEIAGRHLGSLLDTGPRRLLVLDDVWTREQFAPFATSGKRCALLVTTRAPDLLTGCEVTVNVDQMSADQASTLLTTGLPSLGDEVLAGLLEVTGRWPLLLRLVNGILADYARLASDLPDQAGALLAKLRVGGPAVVDELLAHGGADLDVGDPRQRELAVRATIAASSGLLDADDAERFAELAVFAEDEVIPFPLIWRLWRSTSGLDKLAAGRVCKRLAQLALVTYGNGVVELHDVVRDFLRSELGERLAPLNEALLDAMVDGLPTAESPDASHHPLTAWWEVAGRDWYVREHLIEHMLAAGRSDQAESVASDLRWVGARLLASGPAGPAADLARIASPHADRKRRALIQAAHLLAPTEPADAVVDIMISRFAEMPGWRQQASAMQVSSDRPRLVNHWPLPDLPDPSLRRIMPVHLGGLNAVAISPDGTWLATAGSYNNTCIWDAATGEQRAALRHKEEVLSVAICPDGTWLATASADGMVRIWDAATGEQRTTLVRQKNRVASVAISPDSAWLCTTTGYSGGPAEIWDALTGQRRAVLTKPSNVPIEFRPFMDERPYVPQVEALALSPDGTWIAAAERSGDIGIWDAAGEHRATLVDQERRSQAVTISPDCTWLATASADWTARTWDAATGEQRATLTGHLDAVTAVAISPDGTWLATASEDGTARTWDAATGEQRATFTGHLDAVTAVAISPDGTWLATASKDGTARTWDAASGHHGAAPRSGQHRAAAADSRRNSTMAVSPDGTWLVTGSSHKDPDKSLRIWDTATGQISATLAVDVDYVQAVAISPDGTWLATACINNTTQTWDAATGEQRAAFKGHSEYVSAVAISPDGTWVATAGSDGTVRTWDAATGQLRLTFTRHRSWWYSDRVNGLAISPDGTWVVSVGSGRIYAWDAATGHPRTAFGSRKRVSRTVVISPDASWIATGGVGLTQVWKADTGKLLCTLPRGYDNGLNYEWDVRKGWAASAMAVSGNGAWLAIASADNAVRIWDTSMWTVRAIMRVDSPVSGCSWIGNTRIAIAGTAGIYVFDFLTGPDRPLAERVQSADATGRPSKRDLAPAPVQRASITIREKISLVGQDMRGTTHLAGSDLTGADLTDATLADADLTGADLTGADLTGADLSGSILNRARLNRARLTGARINRTNLNGAQLCAATLRDIRWEEHVTARRAVAYASDADPAARRALANAGAIPRDMQPILQLQHPKGWDYTADFSPDGDLLAVCYGSTLSIWDADTGQLLRILACHHATSLAWSPDGRQLATASSDRTAGIWDADSGKLVRALAGHTDAVRSVAWSPDGRLLATGSWDETARVWDAASGVPLSTLSVPSHVLSVAWSPDGRQLATADSWARTARIWDAASWKQVRTLIGHTDAVNSVAWSPDGRQLATASYDKTTRIWDAASGEQRRTLTGHGDTVDSATWSPDGRQLATASKDGSVRIWSTDSWEERHALSGLRSIYDDPEIAWSPDGRQLVVAGGLYEAHVLIWDTASWELARTLAGHGKLVSSVAWSPDGRLLASGGQWDKSARIWGAVSGELMRTLTCEISVRSVAWSPDGRQLATDGGKNSALIWDTGSGELLQTLAHPDKPVLSVAWSSDGRLLATASSDTTARIWDAASGKLIRTLTGHTDAVRSVAWSPDGRLLATTSSDKSARVWDAVSGRQVSIVTSRDDLYSVAWSPDGRQIATSSGWDKTARIWEASSGELVRTMRHDDWVKSVAWSPDGRQLATGGLRGEARVWDAGSGTLLRTLKGHDDNVESVAWSPDGRLLATGGEDGTIRLWTPSSSAEPVATITSLADDGWAAFYPDGRYKYRGAPNGEFFWAIGLHRFDPGELDEYSEAIKRVPLNTPLIDDAWIMGSLADKPTISLRTPTAREQRVPAIVEKPSESLHAALPEIAQFDSIALDAIRHAASMSQPGEVVDTRMILLAVAQVHVRGRWDRIWLYCGHSPDDIASQQNTSDPKVAPREAWEGMELTPTCANGLRAAALIADRRSLPIAPGILILGVLAEPVSGAARALGVGTSIEHGDLMRLVAEELLGW